MSCKLSFSAKAAHGNGPARPGEGEEVRLLASVGLLVADWVVEIMLFPRADYAFSLCFCHADIQMAGVNGYIPAKKWHN